MSTNNSNSLKGQCLCGSIKYSVDKIEQRMANCHCIMCRKFHGAAFSTYGEALIENFHWIKGKEFLQGYKAENGTVRKFCKKCGSSMVFQVSNDTGDLIEFSLGTLDSDIAGTPDVHVFMANKANWLKVEDDLPKYEGYRTSKPL